MKESTGTGLTHTYIAALLLTLAFTAASVAAILWMQSENIQTLEPVPQIQGLENNTTWLESEFSTSGELSEKQKEIIRSSATIVSNVAQDTGVTVTLSSICGDANTAYCKLTVELPEQRNGQPYLSFEQTQLNMDENQTELKFGSSRQCILPDDNPKDKRYSCFLYLRQNQEGDQAHANMQEGTRTLHLGNLRLQDENGQESRIDGTWEFRIQFHDTGKAVELIKRSSVIKGLFAPDKSHSVPSITSFVMTEFGALCQYKTSPDAQGKAMNLNPLVVMKDGSIIQTSSKHNFSDGQCYYEFEAPVPCSEVSFVRLADDVELPFTKKTFD